MEPAKYLTEKLKKTNQLTIEIWLETTFLNQYGPARIVSFSANPDYRNFTLGQTKGKLSFRVRTILNGLNGSRCEFISKEDVLAFKKQHIVATFNHGRAEIYVDGMKIESECGGSIYDYVPSLLGFGYKSIGKFSYLFIIIFPLMWFSYLGWPKRPVIILLLTILPIVITHFICYVCKFATLLSY
jgi:hypothetical protein